MNRFIATKEHRRSTEFADAVRSARTIGLCYGQAGIGKTLSGQRYAAWDKARDLIEDWNGPLDFRSEQARPINAALARNRTVFYTPQVQSNLRLLKEELDQLSVRTSLCVQEHLRGTGQRKEPIRHRRQVIELIVVDEAERLSSTGIEFLRDRYDRSATIGLVFIGMSGLEKQFSRYPQFYSRVGFAHHYRTLTDEELTFVLQGHWKRLGQELDTEDFTDQQAVAAITRITRGNFRLIDRLFEQIERVLKINNLHVITDDVIEAARSTLVIGITE